MTERELEDYAVAHIDEVFACLYSPPKHPVTILGRQVPCRHGIIDLLAYLGRVLFVIEFKAVKADDKVAGQLERYKRAIAATSFSDAITVEMALTIVNNEIAETVVVAPSFTKEALRAVDICIISKRDGDKYTFELAGYNSSRELDTVLAKALLPYHMNIVEQEKARVKAECADILRASAAKRLLEVN
jgi:hypothetical protein